VYRVLSCLVSQHNYRLVLLAALVCAATSFAAFHAYSYIERDKGGRRLAWVFLTAVATGAGIWTTHFVAMLAYEPGHPVGYDETVTIASLLIAIIVAAVGFDLASRGGTVLAAAGGAVTGVGIALMHFTGMRALVVPGTIAWDAGLVVAATGIGTALASAALLAWHRLEHPRRLWAAAGLLTAAICGMHFTAMGAVTIVPDPTIVIPAATIDSSSLAVAISAVTTVVLLALVAATHLLVETERTALERSQELVDAAMEGIVIAKDGRVLNVNRPLLDLTGRSQEELLGRLVLGDLLAVDIKAARPTGEAVEALLQTAGGEAIPVEVVRRRLSNGVRADEVFAIRDLTERQRVERELRRQNEALQQREEELRRQNQRFEDTLANLPHGLSVIDAERRLVVCNARYVQMYGLPASLLSPGTPIDDIFRHLVAAGLYSPEDAEEYRREGLASLFRDTATCRRLQDGRTILVSRQPTGDGGWIAIHDDITERGRLSARLAEQNELLKQHEVELEARNASLDRALAELERQKANLDIALANMSQGLAMFDTGEHLVLANARYSEIYGIAPENVRPGMTLRELIEHRIATGLYPGMTADDVVDNMRKRVALGDASHLVSRPGDGRILSVAVHPRPDGGWVVTLQDITEREEMNARLTAQNTLLQQREAELAAQNARFDTAIGNMSQGMCLYDAEQKIVFANRRYGEIYGLTPEQIKPGTSLEQVFAARAANGAYCDGAEEFIRAGIERFQQLVSEVLELRDGRFISVVRRPMPDGGLLSTHEDITERELLNARLASQNELLKQREQQLSARNEQLDAALENMHHGLAMFDAELRLIVCNRRYADMYGLTPEQVSPGTTVRQIFDYRLASGHYHVKDTSGFVDGWTRGFGESSTQIQELADGRIVSVCRQLTASGGRVVTHEDVTERHRLNARLGEQNRLLKQQEEKLTAQNLQLDAALENMQQGLAMYDSAQRLVVCNRRYAEMYALPPELAQAGTPLKAIIEHRIANGEFDGRSADDLIQNMTARVSGEEPVSYTSHLRDGRHIAVSVQTMADGGTVTTHHDITELRRSQARIAHLALHDTLTGLPNRALLNERLEDALRRVKRGEILAVHLLDLDRFKNVNDTLGHPAGDCLLKMVSERLRPLVRETDTIARMGGDEFAIVQTAIAQPLDATSLAHRVIEALSAPYTIIDHQVIIGASVGIAIGPDDGVTPEQLMRNADLALYRAKGDGRGTYRFFEREMDAQMQTRRHLEDDLRAALPAHQFQLHYQPVVDLASNEVNGFEALVRWRHPERGLLLPGSFIPLAEEIGFIIPLGEWVLREACATAARWPEELKIAVNLSPLQFRSSGLVQLVVNALAATGLDAHRLELEVTESTLLQDCEATLSILFQLRALGVRIAMDDFGTGYSSLSYLQSFPFDRIKIDRSFVKDIADRVGSLNIVRAVAAMANGLGMTTTAEGVETEEQLETVKAEGCTEMQGFLFSQPMPAEEVDRFLRRHGRSNGTALTRSAAGA
jgi:diguanylate cyclase (GGDEF)-like protein/PAS domain S-box-containing protein